MTLHLKRNDTPTQRFGTDLGPWAAATGAAFIRDEATGLNPFDGETPDYLPTFAGDDNGDCSVDFTRLCALEGPSVATFTMEIERLDGTQRDTSPDAESDVFRIEVTADRGDIPTA